MSISSSIYHYAEFVFYGESWLRTIFMNWYNGFREQRCMHKKISLAFSVLSFTIKSIFDYLILWLHILASPYILIFIEFALDWIYMIILQYTQGIGVNPVIKVVSVSKYPLIVEHIIEFLQLHFHGLDGPGISSD